MSASKNIIIKFLKESNSEILHNDLLALWTEIHPDEKSEVFYFLYLSQQWKTFLHLFVYDVKERSTYYPWIYFLKILHTANIELPEKHFETIRQSLKKQDLRIKEISGLKSLIDSIITKMRFAFLQKVQERKQELLSSARIAKSENLLEKQFEYLNKLKKIFPSDMNVNQIISERDKQNAESVLQKIKRVKREKKKSHIQLLSDEEKSIISQLYHQAQDFLKKDPRLAADFSVMFRSLGGYSHSIDFMNHGVNEISKDWHLLDLYLIGRQFIALLSHCDKLKIKYADHPNALFSISYAEALAYWELGERNTAVQLMSQIASMKPDFKSANEILLEWKEESID